MSTVMIVDDTQLTRMRISKLLTKHSYRIIEAEDGDKAVQIYRQTHPDAVLMDITMPNKDGLTALTEILDLDPQAKIIILTALSQQIVILKALKTGAKDFLIKPYNPERVIRALQKVLN